MSEERRPPPRRGATIRAAIAELRNWLAGKLDNVSFRLLSRTSSEDASEQPAATSGRCGTTSLIDRGSDESIARPSGVGSEDESLRGSATAMTFERAAEVVRSEPKQVRGSAPGLPLIGASEQPAPPRAIPSRQIEKPLIGDHNAPYRIAKSLRNECVQRRHDHSEHRGECPYARGADLLEEQARALAQHATDATNTQGIAASALRERLIEIIDPLAQFSSVERIIQVHQKADAVLAEVARTEGKP